MRYCDDISESGIELFSTFSTFVSIVPLLTFSDLHHPSGCRKAANLLRGWSQDAGRRRPSKDALDGGVRPAASAQDFPHRQQVKHYVNNQSSGHPAAMTAWCDLSTCLHVITACPRSHWCRSLLTPNYVALLSSSKIPPWYAQPHSILKK